MKWRIPAKTFLLGEYSAVAGASAIMLTTSPCFELLLLQDHSSLQGIHPDSPAGKWWMQQSIPHGLLWHDPYQGCGGLGASSAQFLGTYLASCYLQSIVPNYQTVLEAYYQSAWQGEGVRPSGYDVLAQLQNRCVYINWQEKMINSYHWVFNDISFLLLQSGHKLATHNHLQTLKLPNEIGHLSATVDLAKLAFAEENSAVLIEAVNTYQQQLEDLDLMAAHSIKQLQALKTRPDILAAKGCGALGADILLLIVPSHRLKPKVQSLAAEGWMILATSENLHTQAPLMENNEQKTLEILI